MVVMLWDENLEDKTHGETTRLKPNTRITQSFDGLGGFYIVSPCAFSESLPLKSCLFSFKDLPTSVHIY